MSDASFIQPKLIPVSDLNWKLAEMYEVRLPYIMFTIPKDFITDLASVPRFMWSLYPPFGLHTGPAVAHDYLYRTPQMRIAREEADKVFLDLMRLAGVGSRQATIMYDAVRLFGSSSYVARHQMP